MPDVSLIAAALLLGAALFAGRSGAGNYLRFAAILCAALAAALLARQPGLAAAVALVVVPLTGASLGLSALARSGRMPAQLPATLALAAALATGLFGFFTGAVSTALLPLVFGGAAMLFSGRLIAMLSGLLLLAAASAGLSAGLSAPLLSLLAVALFGMGVYKRVSSRRTALASAAP